MNRGKVVLVAFPFEDFESVKVRPALCLSEPVGEYRQLVVAYIGSKIPEEILDTDIIIDVSKPDTGKTGLHRTSIVRVHRLVTITTRSIRSEIGRLSEQQWNVVIDKLKRLFLLNRES